LHELISDIAIALQPFNLLFNYAELNELIGEEYPVVSRRTKGVSLDDMDDSLVLFTKGRG